MKEKIKVFAQKVFFWMCVAVGLVGTLTLVAYGASYFIGELDFANACVFSVVPLIATCLFLKRHKEKILSKIFISIEQKTFVPCCMVWLFRTIIITLGVIVLCVVIGVVYLLIWFLCAKFIEFLIGKNILHSEITVLAMLMGYATIVYALFDKKKN